jgi:hypothetical protein
LFAKTFLDALASNKKVLDGNSLFKTVKSRVMLGSDQKPGYGNIRKSGHEEGGDFLFVRKAKAALPAHGRAQEAARKAAEDAQALADLGAAEIAELERKIAAAKARKKRETLRRELAALEAEKRASEEARGKAEASALAAAKAEAKAKAEAEARAFSTRKHNLVFGFPNPEVGVSYDITRRKNRHHKLQLVMGSKVMTSKDDVTGYHFECVLRILDVADGKVTKVSADFSVATRTVGGVAEVLPCQGKRIIRERVLGRTKYRYSTGAAVAVENLGLIRTALTWANYSNPADDLSDSVLWSPGRPVAVGDSWALDRATVETILGAEGEITLDQRSLTGTGTFESIERIDGRNFSKIFIRAASKYCDLAGMKFETPIPASLTLTMTRSMDPKRHGQISSSSLVVNGDSWTTLKPRGRSVRILCKLDMKEEDSQTWIRIKTGE